MPMEGPFKSGILKLKIHMTNLVLPERSNLRKCQRRKKLISGDIAKERHKLSIISYLRYLEDSLICCRDLM